MLDSNSATGGDISRHSPLFFFLNNSYPNSYSQSRLDVYGVKLTPLRVGVYPRLSRESLPVEEWKKAVLHIEALGYSTVFRDDHFYTRSYDPIAMLASAASVTETLNIGSYVFLNLFFTGDGI